MVLGVLNLLDDLHVWHVLEVAATPLGVGACDIINEFYTSA